MIDAPPAPSPLRALVLEDDPVFARALERGVRGLGAEWQPLVCHEVATALAFVENEARELHLALVDLTLPDGSGLDVIESLRRHRPQVPTLVVSSLSSERSVLDAIARGARGYLHKNEPVAVLSHGIEQVLQGHYPISPSLARHLFKQVESNPGEGDGAAAGPAFGLTPKETETLRCIARGMSYNETALHMGVSLSTIQTHIRSLYRKLEVRSQVQAAGRAREMGLL